MAGDVKVAVVSGALSSGGTGTADFTKADFGTPKACIILVGRDAVDDVNISAHSRVSVGFSDFTDNYLIVHQDRDGRASVDSDAWKKNAKSYATLRTGGTIDIEGSASTITDGVRLTNSQNELGGTPLATVILFGGADLVVNMNETTAPNSIDGTTTISHSGFTDGNDKLIFFVGTDIADVNSRSTGINNSFGVCHATGSDGGGWTFVQRCLGWASDHGNAEGTPHSILSTEHVLDIITEAGAGDWAIEVTGLEHSTDTWTITERDVAAGAGMEIYSLALELSDRSAKVGSVDSPTSGATWAPSVSLGFTPQYVGLGLTDLDAEDVIETADVQAGVHGISSNAGSGEETCHSWYNAENAATTDTANLFRSRAIDLRDDDTSQTLQDHSHSSFDDGGWTYTINSEDETVAKKWLYWAIEEAVSGNVQALAAIALGVTGISRSIDKTVAAAVVGLATLATNLITGLVQQALAAVAIGVTAVTRKTFMTKSAIAIGLAASLRKSFKALASIVIGVVALSFIKRLVRALSAIAVGVIDTTRKTSRTMAAAAVGLIAIGRVTKKIMASIAVGLTVLSTVIEGLTRQALAAVAVGATAINRHTFTTLTALAVGVVAIGRRTTPAIAVLAKAGYTGLVVNIGRLIGRR